MARKKQEDVLPIRIRRDAVVTIIGLPHDLSYAEARKIADVVVALGGPAQAVEHWLASQRPLRGPSLADVVRDEPEELSDEEWPKTVPMGPRRAGE